MRRPVRRLALVLVAATGVTAARAAPPAAAPPAAAAAAPAPRSMSRFTAPEYVMGSPKAKVTLVEYGSASCSHCARFDAQVFPALKAKYVDTGKVRYVFREFLTPPPELAAAGFLMARCAGEARYFHVVEQVFAAQPELFSSNDPKAVLVRIAGQNGLSASDLEACMNDQVALDALNARMKDAVDVQKISSTPTFLINGVKLDEHGKEPDLALFDGAIQPLLKAPRRPARRG